MSNDLFEQPGRHVLLDCQVNAGADHHQGAPGAEHSAPFEQHAVEIIQGYVLKDVGSDHSLRGGILIWKCSDIGNDIHRSGFRVDVKVYPGRRSWVHPTSNV